LRKFTIYSVGESAFTVLLFEFLHKLNLVDLKLLFDGNFYSMIRTNPIMAYIMSSTYKSLCYRDPRPDTYVVPVLTGHHRTWTWT